MKNGRQNLAGSALSPKPIVKGLADKNLIFSTRV